MHTDLDTWFCSAAGVLSGPMLSHTHVYTNLYKNTFLLTVNTLYFTLSEHTESLQTVSDVNSSGIVYLSITYSSTNLLWPFRFLKITVLKLWSLLQTSTMFLLSVSLILPNEKSTVYFSQSLHRIELPLSSASDGSSWLSSSLAFSHRKTKLNQIIDIRCTQTPSHINHHLINSSYLKCQL